MVDHIYNVKGNNYVLTVQVCLHIARLLTSPTYCHRNLKDATIITQGL